MVNTISKLAPIGISCRDYVHPWTNSCKEATAGLYLFALVDSLRIYGTVYTLALLSRGKIPTLDDAGKTAAGILQSTAFLSCTAFGYSAFLCSLRRLLGHFNMLTVSALPIFLSSVFAIFIERPSRRPLLCLYVSNTATETVWNMLRARDLVRPLPHGQTLLFAGSAAMLLYYYRTGKHRISGKTDTVINALRYMVGPYEEHGHVPPTALPDGGGGGDARPRTRLRTVYTWRLVRSVLQLNERLKRTRRSPACPHPHGCVHYVLQGGGRMMLLGLLAQTVIKLVTNVSKLRSGQGRRLLLSRDTFSLGVFLGGFAATFRGVSCALRWWRGDDRDAGAHAMLAGLLAGLSFTQYSSSTVALAFMWKALQLSYHRAMERGWLPALPYATELLYCVSTATLFHAAIIEPDNLRPSYWKFLHSLSGGRIASMDREALDAWGLRTTDSLVRTLQRTRTERKLRLYYNL